MDKVLFIILLAGLFSGRVSAQQACSCNTSTDIENLLEDRVMAVAYSQKMKSPEIQFSSEWKVGDIYLVNGETIHSKYLRFNGFSDQLFWLRKKDYQISIIERSTVKGFSLTDTILQTTQVFRRSNFIQHDLAGFPDIFLQVLVEGEISLFLAHRVDYLRNTDEYSSSPQYYVIVNGQIKAISLRRRALVRLLGEQKSKMRSIIRQFDLDLSTERGMVAAILAFNKKE